MGQQWAAFGVVGLLVGIALPSAGLAQDVTINPQLQPQVQNLENLQIDTKQAAIDRLQRPVELTVPYNFSNLPASFGKVAVTCAFEVNFSGSVSRQENLPLRQEIPLSGGSANGTANLAGEMPPDSVLETFTETELRGITDVTVPGYTCYVQFREGSSSWYFAQNACSESNLCAGAQHRLVVNGQF